MVSAEVSREQDALKVIEEKIAEGWAHWTMGGTIVALDEPYRANGILKVELDADGRCHSLTLWTERLSVRESDMLSQRDA